MHYRHAALPLVAVLLAASAPVNEPPPSQPPMLGSPANAPDNPLAGGGPCQPLDCAGVSVAPPPGFDPPSAADFVPDRRPSMRINLFAGSCLNPPGGGPDWWQILEDTDGNGLAQAVDRLVIELDQAYEDGWRRISLVLPAGSLGGQLMASGQWWAMPPEKRDGLTTALPAWIAAHPDATVGIYAGFEIADPCSICMGGCSSCIDCGEGGGCLMCPECVGASPSHIPQTTDAADMCTVHQNFQPWVDLGLYEMWLDAAGGGDPARWTRMLQLAGNPDYEGQLKLAAEPIIHDAQGPGVSEPILSAVASLAVVSLRSFYENFSLNAPPESWVFDPETTEVHVIFNPGSYCFDALPGDGDPCTDCPNWCLGVPEPAGIDAMYDYYQRGYIIQAANEPSLEYARRIYEINRDTIPCPEDLDADGDVDQTDAARLSNHIGMGTGATLYHGDIDDDGDVDVVDYFLLVSHPAYPGGSCE